MRFLLVAVATAFLASNALAQPPAPPRAPDLAAQAVALAPLQWLVGSWEGRGWVDTPAGRQTFRQTESVEARLGGALLVVEGKGYSGVPETLAFNAFAVISHDDRAARTTFRSWTRGYVTDAIADVRPDGNLIWTMTMPGQVIRYTITQPQPGRWREVGERSTDAGGTYTQFFEMELTRK